MWTQNQSHELFEELKSKIFSVFEQAADPKWTESFIRNLVEDQIRMVKDQSEDGNPCRTCREDDCVVCPSIPF